MPAQILDGRAAARAMRQEIAQEVACWNRAQGASPTLAIVQVGGDPASERYVRAIERGLDAVGMGVCRHTLPADAATGELVALLQRLNVDTAVHGIIVQMPLPPQIEPSALQALSPGKDVDGIHPLNAGLLLQGDAGALVPATPLGGLALLERHGVQIEGREAVVVGRSRIVGLPMAMLLLHRHATVTLCHSRTRDLEPITRRAEILVVAVGRPHLITPEMVRPGAAVVDFGINVVDGDMLGDVDPAVAQVAGYWTPMPGGTGPMTNVMLMRNTLQAARRLGSLLR
jgi:methylenetetrahydrofolate dehydrogenase (NADP+) / methenyltetrahydrofolate cyclohydrolase